MTKIDYKCGGCGAEGLKLWRRYMGFAFGNPLLCLKCAERDQGRKKSETSDQIGWLVPAVPTEDLKTFWGYTSVPADAAQRWKDMPSTKAEEYGPLGVDDWN